MYSSIFFLEKKFLRRPFCNLGNGKILVSVMTVSSLSTTHYAYYCFPLAVESLELFWSQTPPPAPRSPPPPPTLPFGRMLKYYYFFVVVCCLMMWNSVRMEKKVRDKILLKLRLIAAWAFQGEIVVVVDIVVAVVVVVVVAVVVIVGFKLAFFSKKKTSQGAVTLALVNL